MRRLLGLTILTLALTATACGDDDGATADGAVTIDSGDRIDSAVSVDAPPSFDAASPVDAVPSALGCLGDPIPTTAPDPVTLSGTTFTIGIGGEQGLEGVDVVAKYVADGTPIENASATSVENGDYSLTADTGGVPLDGYLEATHADYFTTWVYPPTPVYENYTGVATVMLNQGTLGTLEVFQVYQDSEKNGMVAALVLDCDGNPIQGATVTTNPAGAQVVYNSGGFPSTSATSTGSDGIAIITNVPADTTVTIDAEVSGMSLREHDVKTATMTVTSTAIVP